MDETFKRLVGEYYDSIDCHLLDRETFIQVLWVANAFSMYTSYNKKVHRDLEKNN